MKKWLCLLLLLTVALRIPTLFEPNRYADEDIYLTLGQGLREGLVYYRDIHDNKPPLLYVTAAAAGNVRNFRVILLIWNLINVWLIWLLSKKLLKTNWAMILTTAVFVVMTNIPLLEGNIANGEIFMIMPVTAAILLLLQGDRFKAEGQRIKYLLVGILFALGFLFKIPVVFDLLGIMIWLFFFGDEKEKTKQIFLVMMGFLIPILASLIYYSLMGAGEVYLRSALMQNIGYLSSWEGEKQAFYHNGLFQRGMVALIFSGMVLVFKKAVGKKAGLVMMWMIWGLFGTNLSGRPYPHYLLEIVPAGSLLIGIMMEKFIEKKWVAGIISVMVLALIPISAYRYNYWYYKSIPYYQNFIEYVLGKKNLVTYKSFFGDNVIRNEQVAEYIKQRTNKTDKIFVWGTEPAIYVLSERLPVGRYTTAYHVNDFKGQAETMEAIEKKPPKFMVIMKNEGSKFDELNKYLVKNYKIATVISEAEVWELN